MCRRARVAFSYVVSSAILSLTYILPARVVTSHFSSAQDAIIAAAGEELRSSSGSAEGSDCGSGDEKKGSPVTNDVAGAGAAGGVKAEAAGAAGAAAGGIGAGASATARNEGRDGGGATRKSTREAENSEKAKPADKLHQGSGGGGSGASAGEIGGPGGTKRKHGDTADAGRAGTGEDAAAEAQEVELEPNGKPKLPRPTVPVACPRCASKETKFCYYNNYNIKQPRYFCRVSPMFTI